MKVSDWLFDTKLGQACRYFIAWVAPSTAGLLALYAIHCYEINYNPVITNWTISSFKKVDDKFVVAGSLRKARTCELIGTSIVAVPKDDTFPSQVLYQINPVEIRGGNVPIGFMTWGPWEMPIPAELMKHRDALDRIEVVGLHRCHLLWNQETIYGTIRLQDLPE